MNYSNCFNRYLTNHSSITIMIVAICIIFISNASNAKEAKRMTKQKHEMPQRYVKKLNQSLPFLGLGTVELGRDWGIHLNNSSHPSEENAKTLLLTAYQSGFTLIDTASSYQLSEERIGRYLPRSKYQYMLVTKPGEHSMLANDDRCKIPSYDNIYCRQPGGLYDFSRAAIIKDINESLSKLGVKQLDIALLHLDNHTAAEVIHRGEALETLRDLKQAGIIKYIGISLNGPVAKEVVEQQDIDVIELEYNLLNQTNKATIDLAYAKGMAVIVRGGLGTGLLTPYVAQHYVDPHLPYGDKIRALLELTDYDYDKLTSLALAFLFHDPHISTVIIGADQIDFIQKDLTMLLDFKDEVLLEKAQHKLAHMPTPKEFTEIMGEYYHQ